MYENYPLGVYIPDCTAAIDFDELASKGVKFVVARLGSGGDINPQYGVSNNKRYLDLGFGHVCDECHRTGMFCIPEWRLLTAPNDYPRDYPNPAADKQIVPLQYGLASKTFQAIAIRMTDAMDSNSEIARAVSMFYGYVRDFYGKKMNFLTINRAMFEQHSPALGDTISRKDECWPLFIVDDRDLAVQSLDDRPTGNVVVETPGMFNATNDGMIWECGKAKNYSILLWMGSEAHMLEKMGEKPVNYDAGSGDPGGGTTNPPVTGDLKTVLEKLALLEAGQEEMKAELLVIRTGQNETAVDVITMNSLLRNVWNWVSKSFFERFGGYKG